MAETEEPGGTYFTPKNFTLSRFQVHLPDDTKPSIVFNEATGRWENTAEGEEDTCAPAAPPPMMNSAAAPGGGGGGPGGPANAAPMNFRANLGKKKGRGYVDVLSQSGMAKPMEAGSTPGLVNGNVGGPPGALLDPSTPPAPQDGPTSLDYGGGGGAPPPMMMFNPSAMGGAQQPPAF